MEKEQTTIRLPVELMEQLKAEADRKGSYRQITMRISPELYKEMKLIANQTGLTISSVLIVAIWRNVLKLKYLPL